MPYWKALVWFLTITSVFMSASYTMLVPFLPMYLIDELGVAQSDVNIWSGLIFSISFLISAIMAPIWGALSDSDGRTCGRLFSHLVRLGRFCANPVGAFCHAKLPGLFCGTVASLLSHHDIDGPERKNGVVLGTHARRLDRGRRLWAVDRGRSG